jgi:hypothetical protein
VRCTAARGRTVRYTPPTTPRGSHPSPVMATTRELIFAASGAVLASVVCLTQQRRDSGAGSSQGGTDDAQGAAPATVEARTKESETVLVQVGRLEQFCAEVFVRCGCLREEAVLAGQLLVMADHRGIDSHGVARLHAYFTLLQAGEINPRPHVRKTVSSSTTATVDGDNGLGLIVGPKANAIGQCSWSCSRPYCSRLPAPVARISVSGARGRHLLRCELLGRRSDPALVPIVISDGDGCAARLRMGVRQEHKPLRHRRLLLAAGGAARHDRLLDDEQLRGRGTAVGKKKNAGNKPHRCSVSAVTTVLNKHDVVAG